MIGELAALGAALSWTISAILYKKALAEAKPVSANIVRCACTSLILVVFLVGIGKFNILTSLPSYAIVLASISGIIGLGLGDTLYMTSLKLIGVARAVPITCTYPLFNLLLTALLLEENVTFSIVLGAAAIVFGIWLLSHETDSGKTQVKRTVFVKGLVYALATAIIWSVSITMIDVAVTLPETSSLDNALAINTVRLVAVAAILLMFSPAIDRKLDFIRMSKATLASLVLGGVVALGVGWFLLTFSFLNISEAIAVPISSTTPLFSTLSGVIFLRERVTARNAIGSIITVSGVFLLFIV